MVTTGDAVTSWTAILDTATAQAGQQEISVEKRLANGAVFLEWVYETAACVCPAIVTLRRVGHEHGGGCVDCHAGLLMHGMWTASVCQGSPLREGAPLLLCRSRVLCCRARVAWCGPVLWRELLPTCVGAGEGARTDGVAGVEWSEVGVNGEGDGEVERATESAKAKGAHVSGWETGRI